MTPRSVLRKKMIRETLSNWKQFLAIVGIGTIAVTLFVGLLSSAKSLSNRVDKVYNDGNMADMYVTTSKYSWRDLDGIKGLLDPDDAVEGRFEFVDKVDGMSCYAAISPTMPEISGPTIVKDSTDLYLDSYFLIDKALMKENAPFGKKGYEIGDYAEISYSFSSYLSKDSVDRLSSYVDSTKGGRNILAEDDFVVKEKITGFMTCPENITTSSYNNTTYMMSKSVFRSGILKAMEENYTSDGVILIKDALGWGEESEMEDGSSFPQTNQYLVKLKNTSTLESKENAIKSFFDSKHSSSKNLLAITDRATSPWSMAVDTDVTGARQLTYVFPAVFFLVALLVILTTISQMILKERTQIGTMKALGLTKKEIYYHYISLTLTLVGISSLLGCIIGPLLVPSIMCQKYDLLYTLPTRNLFVFPVAEGILSVVLFMAASALVTILICRKEIALSPAQSMRPALVSFKGKGSENKKRKGTILLSLKMAFRNIRVNVTKSIMVVVGVMGCTALLVCGYGIDDTLKHGIDSDMSTFYHCDFTYTYNAPYESKIADIRSEVPELGKIEEYYSATTSISFSQEGSATTKSYKSTLRLFDDDYSFFKHEIPYGKVSVSSKVVDELKVGIGDMVSFTHNGDTYEGEIGAIYDSFSVNGIFAFFADYPSISHLYNAGFADVNEGESISDAQTKLAEIGFISNCTSMSEMYKRITDIMSGISLMTLAVKVFAVLLAIVVLYNLALLNFRERTRDIATLKVLGFTKTEIALSLLVETLSLTLLGVVVGFFLGYPFMYVVLYVNKISIVNFMYTIFPATYLISFAITFGVAFIVNLILSNLTGRVKMVESLKSVE